MFPQLRLICAQGRDSIYLFTYLFYIYIYSRYVFTGTHPLGPRWPPAGIRSFTSIQVAHTHQKNAPTKEIAQHGIRKLSHRTKKGKGGSEERMLVAML